MQSITVHQLREREGTPLIDVREVDEFAAGHVPGAVNLPMSTIGDQWIVPAMFTMQSTRP